MAGLTDHELDLLEKLPSGLIERRIVDVAAIDRALLKCTRLPKGSAMRVANERRLKAKRRRLFKKIEREGNVKKRGR